MNKVEAEGYLAVLKRGFEMLVECAPKDPTDQQGNDLRVKWAELEVSILDLYSEGGARS